MSVDLLRRICHELNWVCEMYGTPCASARDLSRRPDAHLVGTVVDSVTSLMEEVGAPRVARTARAARRDGVLTNQPCRWALARQVVAGNASMGISGVTKTRERDQFLDFSLTYFKSGLTIMVRPCVILFHWPVLFLTLPSRAARRRDRATSLRST